MTVHHCSVTAPVTVKVSTPVPVLIVIMRERPQQVPQLSTELNVLLLSDLRHSFMGFGQKREHQSLVNSETVELRHSVTNYANTGRDSFRDTPSNKCLVP